MFKTEICIVFDTFFGPNSKMTTSFHSIARTTASTGKFTY